MRPFIPPFTPEQNDPEMYWVRCPKCGWKDSFALAPDGTSWIPAGNKTEPQGTQQVTKLPAKCPKCGATLEKHKLPPRIKY